MQVTSAAAVFACVHFEKIMKQLAVARIAAQTKDGSTHFRKDNGAADGEDDCITRLAGRTLKWEVRHESRVVGRLMLFFEHLYGSWAFHCLLGQSVVRARRTCYVAKKKGSWQPQVTLAFWSKSFDVGRFLLSLLSVSLYDPARASGIARDAERASPPTRAGRRRLGGCHF